MKKELIDNMSENPVYLVDLYQLLGKSYSFMDYCCDAESLGKIIISVSQKNKNPYRENIGECTEITEHFSIPLINCAKTTRYDSWYDENVTELHLPYKYDYWDKYKLYVVRSNDINELNIATLEDIKKYEPKKEIWYKLLKEIQEKGIDYNYQQEVEEKIFGKARERSNKLILNK